MIRNIIFDIGNVLIGFDWNRYVRTLTDEETAEHMTGALWGTGYWKELDIARFSEDEILRLFISAAPEYEAEIREAYERVGECVTRMEWAIPLIRELKSRGYRVLYLSNMSEHVMNSNPEAFDFVREMDGGIYSCHIHRIKPDPEMFRALISEFELVPEECLFIDDHLDNTAVARVLGMKAIRFTGYEQLHADLERTLSKDAGHDKVSVLCYGDSNTYGYDPSTGGRYPLDVRWTTILGEMLGERYEVIPEGLNGRTTAYDRPEATWKNGAGSFIACLGTHKPVDILVIMLGTNDSIAVPDLTAEDIAGGMETLVKLTEQTAPELQGYIPLILIAAPAAVAEDCQDSPFAFELTPEAVRKTREIGPLYRDIADRHMCLALDATQTVAVSPLDSVHLGPEGHRHLAGLIRDALTGKAPTDNYFYNRFDIYNSYVCDV